jgi:demethoxyubiquinone hydroxylase (CLK1/Coq7/Cat5 family)
VLPVSIAAGAVQEALTEHYNEQLRVLRDAGQLEAQPSLRATLRTLRDQQRAPDDAPKVAVHYWNPDSYV